MLGGHGDRDEFISHAATREMIARLGKAGGQEVMFSVPDGKHVAMNGVTELIFAFFARHHRRQVGQARRRD